MAKPMSLKKSLTVPRQTSYKDLVKGGFIAAAEMVKKQEWAQKNGMVFVPNETIQNYEGYLEERDLEFDFKEIEDFRPTNEIIPISEIEKVNKITKKGWFDRIFVTTVRKLKDPIVIGIIDNEEHYYGRYPNDLRKDNDYYQITHYDWYIIAAWK